MTSTRTILVVLPGCGPLDPEQVKALNAAFDLRFVTDAAALAQLLSKYPDAVVVGSLRPAQAAQATAAQAPIAAVQSIGDGVAIVDAAGTILWMNSRLAGLSDTTRRMLAQHCQQTLKNFNEDTPLPGSVPPDSGVRVSMDADGRSYDLFISPASADGTVPLKVESVVGVLWDATASHSLDQRIAAIDAAGAELLKIEAAAIADLNMAERLWLLEDKIVGYVRDLLHFENFEVRLINRRTNQLELAVAVGISPLKIGEVIYADAEGNGISGYVAATGRSYLCHDVRKDPLYRQGLDNAASSLTVPLRLHDKVVGVINVESGALNAFTEVDQQLAERFGRFVASALNVLDLLVIERCATNEQATKTMVSEVGRPLDAIRDQAALLRAQPGLDERVRQEVQRIADAAAQAGEMVRKCATGPRTVLETDQAFRSPVQNAMLLGKRVLVADDEPAIRETITALLRQAGCDVTVCNDGKGTIEAIAVSASEPRRFDLVVSDIKMPDRNGYEVFRAAKDVWADTAVILMTGFGYDPHHSIVRASQEGLHSFLFKPFKASQLLEEVGKALAKRHA